MIRLFLYAVTPSGLRMSWLRHASLALFPEEFRADLDELHRYFPSLAIVVPGVVPQVSAKNVGWFFATLERTAIILTAFLTQHPTPEQIQRYCKDLENYLEMECRDCPALRELDLRELATFCEAKLEGRRLSGPRASREVSSLPPLTNREAFWIVSAFLEPVTVQVLSAMSQAHIPTCRSNMSFRKFVEASRGYKDGMLHSTIELPFTYLGDSDDDVNSDMDDDLQPTGERILIEDFCKPVQSVPEGVACAVCMVDVHEDNKNEERPVITKCAHYFHQVCLDSWVNESAMNGANACPQCRAEMCQARAREPVSRLQSEAQEAEDGDFIDSMQEEALHAEGEINRGSGLFSRLRSRFRRN